MAKELIESFDNHAPFRNMIQAIAAESQHDLWAGIPMPLETHELVVEKTYPAAQELMEVGADKRKEFDPTRFDRAELPEGVSVRNRWWSASKRAEIIIWNEPDGRITAQVVPQRQNAGMLLETIGASVAWGVDQEQRALMTLGGLVRHHTFKHYLLTGMMMETSKRSGLSYIFRKLRPTVVIDARRSPVRVFGTLCLHPIGYYNGSWAGAMCPTDDVIAHLIMMRGDEHMFWKRANFHRPDRPESGL